MSNHNFNILIVEDEGIVAADLAARLTHSGYQIIGIADNFDEAITIFKLHKPDLVLLDITIKGNKNGIDIATEITNILPTPFIFITAQVDAETIDKAKNTFPSAYLVKPFTTGHLLISVELAIHNFAYQKKGFAAAEVIPEKDNEEDLYPKQEHVFIKDLHTFIKIHLQEITYIEAKDNYVRIFTPNKSYLVRCTLTKAMERLSCLFLVRVHRSFCVNINHIDRFTEYEITVANTQIPIGRSYKQEFIRQFEIR